jgi:U2 small nuclear ribonucleoprotein B''
LVRILSSKILTANRLYVKNLPDKIRKPDIRLSLYTLFSTYGTVLDVVAMRTVKMRGQAHVVFRDIQSSTQAMRALQGFDFFGKDMVSFCLD